MDNTAGKIYSAIPNVMNDIGVVAKDKVNKQQGFRFRSIDDVYNVLHPALSKNKVFIVPEIISQERVIKHTKSGTEMEHVICNIRFTFFAEDGSFIQTIIVGEGQDTGDKATNKAMAIAYKYACFQVFCIPTEEMSDPDAESLEMEQEVNKKRQANKKNSTRQPPKKEDGAEGKSLNKEQLSGDARITEAMVNTIRAEQARTGATDKQILGRKAVKAKTIEEMTVDEFKYIMDIFKITKTIDIGGGLQNE